MFLQFRKSPLLAAFKGVHTKAAKLLIDRGADVVGVT